MTALYVDASAIVKTYVPEVGSDDAAAVIGAASGLIASRILYTEVGAAISRRIEAGAERDEALEDWDELWGTFDVVELDPAVGDHALGLARFHGLGTLDAIHLASALRVPAVPMRFATWDRALALAARGVGLRVVPVETTSA